MRKKSEYLNKRFVTNRTDLTAALCLYLLRFTFVQNASPSEKVVTLKTCDLIQCDHYCISRSHVYHIHIIQIKTSSFTHKMRLETSFRD